MCSAQRSVNHEPARTSEARPARRAPAAWERRWARMQRRAARGARAMLLAVALAWAPSAWTPAHAAEGVVVSQAELVRVENGEPGLALSVQFAFDLPPVLEEAVNRGIALYFVIDFEAYRQRWYWFDRKLVDTALTYRLTYSPLTRQYRLARGALAQPFDSLGEALATLRRVRGWRVADAAQLAGGDVRASVRLRLDTSQLPKPFQVNAITNRDWSLSSDWSPVALPAEAQR
jgi:hypothetical protein